MRDGYLDGRMTLRYGNACYPDGRAVPIIGFIRRDGEALVTHFYDFTLGPGHQDTGAYMISDTVWDRIVGAR